MGICWFCFVCWFLVFFSSPFGDLKFFLPTEHTFSAVALCFFFSLPVPQVSTLDVIDTSILTAIAFALAWFKCYIVHKLNLGGETKPHGGLTSRLCTWVWTIKNPFAILHWLAHHTTTSEASMCHTYCLAIPHPLYRLLTKTSSRYVFLELKEFLFTSTSLLAYVWVERWWRIAQLRSRIILGRGQCSGSACCLPGGSGEIGKETVIWWIIAISQTAPGAVQLSAAALLVVNYRVIIQRTMLKQRSSKFILGNFFMLSRNEEVLCKNVMLFIHLPNSHASAVYLSSPFSCCE